MTDLPQPQDFGSYGDWAGREVLDADGRPVGTVEEIYLDEATERPEWVLVGAGDRARIVPLADATIEARAIRVAQPGERIKQAPPLDPGDTVDRDQERLLYSHYGLRYSDEESSSGLPAPEPEPRPAATSGELGRADARNDLEGATEPASGVRPVPPRLRRYRAPEPTPRAPEPVPAPPPASPPPPPPPGPLDRLRPVAPVAGALLVLVALLALVRRRRD